MPIALSQDHRTERAHLLMDQPHRVAGRIVRPEAVRAHQFGEVIGMMGGRVVAAAAHFGQPNGKTRLCELPGSLGSGEAAADDVNIVCHAAPIRRSGAQMECGAVPVS